MKIIENTLFLPKSRGFLPLITVWLEVQVLSSAQGTALCLPGFLGHVQPPDRFNQNAAPHRGLADHLIDTATVDYLQHRSEVRAVCGLLNINWSEVAAV